MNAFNLPRRVGPLWLSVGLAVVLLTGCAKEKIIQGGLVQRATPYERYEAALQAAGLQETAIGRSWLQAGRHALSEAIPINSPFREVGYLDPVDVAAMGYRIDLAGGQKLAVDVGVEDQDSMEIFIDLFELPSDSTQPPRHVAIADSARQLAIEARRDGTYLLRIQPELLRGGRYTVNIRVDASLDFPVTGKDSQAIYSFFGAPRDGGARDHHGVDIFAPRGTPVVAISPGFVVRVNNTPRGGKVVWVRDIHRNQAYYYAHLDSQLVHPNVRVEPGDTLGLIGNTGNARTTPPHLHFGIYASRRPVDPFPYINALPQTPPLVAADTSRLGSWVRITARVAALRPVPYPTSPSLSELPRHTALRVLGSSDNWYRVALPDGTSGFVQAHQTEEALNPLRNLLLTSGQSVRDRPNLDAPTIDSLDVASEVPVFGEFGDFVGVLSPSGRPGWIAMD